MCSESVKSQCALVTVCSRCEQKPWTKQWFHITFTQCQFTTCNCHCVHFTLSSRCEHTLWTMISQCVHEWQFTVCTFQCAFLVWQTLQTIQFVHTVSFHISLVNVHSKCVLVVNSFCFIDVHVNEILPISLYSFVSVQFEWLEKYLPRPCMSDALDPQNENPQQL